jgi:plastocyanin
MGRDPSRIRHEHDKNSNDKFRFTIHETGTYREMCIPGTEIQNFLVVGGFDINLLQLQSIGERL